ncbi:hypothetical protein [Salinimicrobium oceani]|uniref:Secreted protein n=1 Tax=Salinimicrobium oceani TaxID=2722702 RepID=A0ABX1CY91_9FLAO|nr:hypothetical protein [Salinimicrobium oceani]NJW52349.1 hypothetical protein [Salinimicrobium oceani]
MKRLALLFALLFTFSSGFVSCRDTEREADDVEVSDDMEEVGDDIEDAGEEIEDEID